MKKLYIYLGLALGVLAAGCTKDGATGEVTPAPVGPETEVTVKLNVSFADANCEWTGEEVFLVNGVEAPIESVTEDGVAKATVKLAALPTDLKVVVPKECYEEGDVISFPDIQHYYADSCDPRAMILIGYTADINEYVEPEPEPEPTPEEPVLGEESVEGAAVYEASVSVKNIAAILSIPVTSEEEITVSTIELAAISDSDVLTGKVSVDFAKGTYTPVKTGKAIVLDCGEEGVVIGPEPTYFNIVVPAAKYSGFDLTIESLENQCIVELDNEMTFAPTDVVELAPVAYKAVEKQDVTLTAVISEEGIVWNEGDMIVVNNELSSPVAAEQAGGQTATFDLKQIAIPYKALYPNSRYTVSGRLTLPENQFLYKGDYDHSAMVMVAYSTEETLNFTNLCGLIKIPVTNARDEDPIKVSKIVVTSLDENVALGGRYSINYRNATMECTRVGNEIVLEPEAPITLEATETADFYAVVPAGKYPKGILVEIYTDFESEPRQVKCTPAAGLVVSRGTSTAIEVSEYSDVRIEAITNAEEFRMLISALNSGREARFMAASGEVVLANDIDLAGVSFDPITGLDGAGLVCGFDGQGHKILNWESDHAIFEKIGQGGHLHDVVLDESCVLTIPEIEANTTMGFLANTVVAGGKISNCVINAKIETALSKLSKTITFGTVAGSVTDGVVENCTNNSNIAYNFSAISAIDYLGGIVGAVNGTKADITPIVNCVNKGNVTIAASSVTANQFVGGIVSTATGLKGQVLIDGCTNEGNITIDAVGVPKFMYLGGVLASSTTVSKASKAKNQGTIANSNNRGNIHYSYTRSSNGTYCNIGGVCGYVEGTVDNLVNYGKVEYLTPTASGDIEKGTTRPAVGGVVGCVFYSATNCSNYGAVTTDGVYANGTADAVGAGGFQSPQFGGVFGNVGPTAKTTSEKIDNCHNYGNLNLSMRMLGSNATKFYQGGVVAYTTVPISNCSNEGAINFYCAAQVMHAAGVVGYTLTTVTGCSNKGALTFSSNTEADGNCGNQSYCGGVAGFLGGTANYDCDMENCSNSGELTFLERLDNTTYSYLGGIVGQYNKTNNMTGCKNSGKVTSLVKALIRVGGLAGSWNGMMEDCENSGTIEVTNARYNVAKSDYYTRYTSEFGGLAGYANASAVNCRSLGNIICNTDAETMVGGIFGGFAGSKSGDTYNRYIGANTYVKCSITTGEGVYAGYFCGGPGSASPILEIGNEDEPVVISKSTTLNGVALDPADACDETKLIGLIRTAENDLFGLSKYDVSIVEGGVIVAQ